MVWNKKAQSMGGSIMAVRQKEEALRKYLVSPKICEWCGEIILPTNSQRIAEVRLKRFCNRSCAAKFNNNIENRGQRKYKPRKKYYCIHCGEETINHRKTCDDCNPNIIDWSQITKKSFREKFPGASNFHGRIRDLSRRVYKNSQKPKKCYNCGYNKVYQVCHIKPVSKFDENTSVTVINDIENLIALCPNCHWEFDQGILKIS